MNQHCLSCAAPLTPDFKAASDRYCKYCSDASGKLLPKDPVQQHIANWFKLWQPGVTEKQALSRAALYMKAMPAWAE
jgi:hypothetical protein